MRVYQIANGDNDIINILWAGGSLTLFLAILIKNECLIRNQRLK